MQRTKPCGRETWPRLSIRLYCVAVNIQNEQLWEIKVMLQLIWISGISASQIGQLCETYISPNVPMITLLNSSHSCSSGEDCVKLHFKIGVTVRGKGYGF